MFAGSQSGLSEVLTVFPNGVCLKDFLLWARFSVGQNLASLTGSVLEYPLAFTSTSNRSQKDPFDEGVL